MSRAPFLYIGVLITVIISSIGLVSLPDRQLRGLEPVTDPQGVSRPLPPGGAVLEGRQLYIGYGCLYCHSQQVRPPGFGADLERGWGGRRTVARDYIWDAPVLLGTMRTGPDLADIAQRQPSENWHLLHLYDPRLTSPGSIMPAFRFLFEERSGAIERPTNAVELPPGEGREGVFLVPTGEGAALVAYLRSLNHDYKVPEVP